jgi:DNA-binding SARP family transcriptional activator
MRIRLLGSFEVSIGSRVIREDEWRLRKAASLIKLLALAPDHHLHREQIMDLLWPDLTPRAAANNLHQALHVARRTLEREAVTHRHLSTHGESLALYPNGGLWVDAEAFGEAAEEARRARDIAAYRAALDLYAGDLLPGDRYEDWTEGRRQELRRKRSTLLFELASLYERRGDHGLGVENLTGSGANDRLTGSAVVNKLIGSNGADALFGLGGPDTLNSKDGVNGNDTLNGGLGTDTCIKNATEASITSCP